MILKSGPVGTTFFYKYGESLYGITAQVNYEKTFDLFKPGLFDFVIACPDGYREDLKIQKYQEFSERSMAISMVNELNAG